MAETKDFTLILVQGDAAGASKLARTLSIDENLARQLCQTAPVILAEGLTKSDVKEYSPRLSDLSKYNLEFRITARPTHGIPKVQWEGGQAFTGGDAGFTLNNSAFVCPGCGEGFLFQRSAFKIEEAS